AITADLAVDLGATHSLWLNQRSGRFVPPNGTIRTTLGRGMSGEMRGHVGRVRRLEIGSFAFDRVVTIFPDLEYQNPGGGDFRDGFVGAEILTRFIVTFDYPHQRMVLERGGRFTEPFEYDMSGMTLERRQPGRAVITAITPGSPAGEAGIRPGDELLAIDGQ